MRCAGDQHAAFWQHSVFTSHAENSPMGDSDGHGRLGGWYSLNFLDDSYLYHITHAFWHYWHHQHIMESFGNFSLPQYNMAVASTRGNPHQGCFPHSGWRYTVTYFEITRSTVHASLWRVCTLQANSRVRLSEVGRNAEISAWPPRGGIQDDTYQLTSTVEGNDGGHERKHGFWRNLEPLALLRVSVESHSLNRLSLCPDPSVEEMGLIAEFILMDLEGSNI